MSRTYGRTEVLHQVSFEIAPGEMVGLTGPSGSGKTTLLQIIGSLDHPTSGRVTVGDTDVSACRHPAMFRRRTVGFVFQLHHLLPTMTVRENVELPMVASHVKRRDRAVRAQELLEEVGLGDRGGSLPSELSGGERQRVAVARALVNEPPLVLADEPTGALDSKASGRVWELLSDIRERHGTTMIIASHEARLIEHTERVFDLLDGRLVGVMTRTDDPLSRVLEPPAEPVRQVAEEVRNLGDAA